MKILKQVVAIFFITVLLFACNKSSDGPAPADPASIAGVWTGKYGNDNSSPNIFFSLHFKAGGVIEELDQSGAVIGTGTWKVENNIITGTYKWPSQTKFNIIGTYNSQLKKILGNWGYGNSNTDGGLYELAKN
ncbi:MAG: hypothetical protein H7Y27_14760 [Gemmatimonadaceae bacterium]|nr:hypothetical protein [Chitinophagaceae bacterium]